MDWGDFQSFLIESSAAQRTALGECLAEACAAFNTFDYDGDADGVGTQCDNCPRLSNRDQQNTAGSWLGDRCEDTDGDGLRDDRDNCAWGANADQADGDADGWGDVCDDDLDQDGVSNQPDNCPVLPNPDQRDTDEDGSGDACDDDDDGDGIVDVDDNCPRTSNVDQADRDRDGIGDVCDRHDAFYRDAGDACVVAGSIVEVESQVLRETLSLPGTGLFLTYASNRVPGFHQIEPPRDLRPSGLGGWTLAGHQHWEQDGDEARLLLGEGGQQAFTDTHELNGLTLVPSLADDAAYLFDDSQRHVRTVDALTGDTLQSFTYDAQGRVTVVDSPDGVVATFEYVFGGREVLITGRWGDRSQLSLDEAGNLTEVMLPGGRQYMFSYDWRGRLTELATPRALATDVEDRQRFTYDIGGLLITDEGLDGASLTLSRHYDDDGSLEVRRARAMDIVDGEVRWREYLHRTDVGGHRSVVDPANRVSTVRVLPPNELDGFVSGTTQTDEDGNETRQLINPGNRWTGTDDHGRTVVTPAPMSGLAPMTIDTTTQYTLAPNGVLGALSIASVEHTAHRDGLEIGRETIWPQGQVGMYGDRPYTEAHSAEGRTSVAVFEEGRIVEVHAGQRHPLRYTYGADGRLTHIRQGIGETERSWSYVYDDVERTVVVTNPLGHRQQTQLNEALDVAEIRDPDQPDTETSFVYDEGGALTSLQVPGGAEHQWMHTLGDHLETRIKPATEDAPEGSVTQYEVALDGRPTSTTLPDGTRVQAHYDDAGRPTLVNVVGADGGPIRSNQMTWSNEGRLLEVQAEGGPDLADGARPFSTQRPLYQGPRAVGFSQEITHAGNPLHWAQARIESDPETWKPAAVQIEGRQGTARLAFEYDRDGQRTRVGDLHITNDGLGLGLPTATRIGDAVTLTEWSRFAEVHSRTTTFNGERHAMTVQRDATGRPVEITECFDLDCDTSSFEYDPLGWLIRATTAAGEHRYTYDTNGNRLSHRAPEGAWEVGTLVDAQDRLLSYAGGQFEHDAQGRRVRASDGPWQYVYDTQGSLLRVIGPGNDVEYLTGPLGQRVARRKNGGPWTWWLYDGLLPLAEFSDGRLQKVFVFSGAQGYAPDYMITYGPNGAESGRYRFVVDHVGSVRGLLDLSTGAWVERTDYSPFGRRIERLEAPAGLRHPFGFASGLSDPATGLVRFGARDYDPWTGRWTAQDPIGFGGGDTNLYAYVHNSPIGFVDPTGLFDYLAFDDKPHTSIPSIEMSKFVLGTLGGIALEEGALAILTGGTGSLLKWAWRGGKWAGRGAKAAWEAYRARRVPCAVVKVVKTACFVAGTTVVTSDGVRPIEAIQQGDLVLSKDEDSGEVVYSEVVRTFVTPDRPVLTLYLAAEDGVESMLGVTPEHPFWVIGRGWIAAGALTEGDRLFTAKQGWLRVEKSEAVEGTTTVYVKGRV
jgi:RHS repeat-associated protein